VLKLARRLDPRRSRVKLTWFRHYDIEINPVVKVANQVGILAATFLHLGSLFCSLDALIQPFSAPPC
jgi:hypothetical protein